MKKLVIANRGAAWIGKSAAIIEVYSLLKSMGYKILLEERQRGDIKAIFEIGEIKVGIESLGDPGCEMEDTMEEFVNRGCEIIVTACRTKSDTFKKVTEYLGVQNGYDILWCAHYVYKAPFSEKTQRVFNQIYAKNVVQIIEGRICGRF